MPQPRGGLRWLPRTMASRLYLILAGGLLIAHALSFGMLFYERYESATSMLMTNLEQDVVVAVNLLDPEGTVVALSGGEFRLLRVFLDHPNRVLNRDQLLNLTQGRDAELFDRSIDLLVSRLRQRLGDGAREQSYIKTVRSEGYVFSMAVTVVGEDE